MSRILDRSRVSTLWVACAVVGAGASCTVERLVPDQVAMGVARLSVRNAGTVVSLLDADTRCGFASAAAQGSLEQEGQVGGVGVVRWTVTNCELDYGPPQQVSEDCHGNKTLVGGSVVVTATKEIHGTLTGNPDSPAVPAAADAVRFTVHIQPSDYQVLATNSKASLTIHSGELDYEVAPRLAVSASLGVCSVAGGDVTVSNLRWKDGVVTVHNDGRSFDVDVPTSNLQAQVGRWHGAENLLEGTIKVWNTLVRVPTFMDKDGLDPDYDPAHWEASYACTPDLALPVSHDCGSLNGALADGAARLTVALFGNVATALDKDTRCGFASTAVLEAAQVTGELGLPNAQAVMTLNQACAITFPPNTVLSEDCNGKRTLVGGTVRVTGTKTLSGIASGNTETPIVPTGRDPAVLALTIEVDNFRVSFSDSTQSITAESGVLSGRVSPRVGRDTQSGACSIATPNARFEDLSWANGALLVGADGNTFRLEVQESDLEAQNGTRDDRTNYLGGTIRVNGEAFTVPLSGNSLDPAFDAQSFQDSYACTANLQEAASDADCILKPTVVDGAARLSVAVLGTLADVLDADTRCGFSSQAVIGTYQQQGAVGERGGQVTWTISQPCTLDFPQPTLVSQDCNGVATYLQGQAVVTGTKVVRGIVTGDPGTPAVPTSRDPAELTMATTLNNLTIHWSDGNKRLRVASGQLSGKVRPRLALDTTLGACSVATPVAEIADVRWQNGALYVGSDGLTFRVNADSSSLLAQNGNKDGRVNYLQGTMTVDGESLLVPHDGTTILDPEYNQQRFDQSYACTANMQVPSSEQQCSFTTALAQNVGRLLILTAGTLGTLVNKDTSCGFENLIVKATPAEVVGDPGEQGSLRWEIEDCRQGYNSPTNAEDDCLGGELVVTGHTTMDAGRTVTGLRESLLLLLDSIVPDTRSAVEIRLNNMRFENFSVAHRDNTGLAKGVLTITSAQMSAIIRPTLGERDGEPGVYDVSVPTAFAPSDTIVDITSLEGYVTAEGKRFNIRLQSSHVDGANGPYHSRENELRGFLTLDGTRVDLTPPIELDPEYDPATFVEGYICTNELRGPIPAQ